MRKGREPDIGGNFVFNRPQWVVGGLRERNIREYPMRRDGAGKLYEDGEGIQPRMGIGEIVDPFQLREKRSSDECQKNAVCEKCRKNPQESRPGITDEIRIALEAEGKR